MSTYTAKSVVIDMATNYGDTGYSGLRSVDFWYEGSKLALTTSDLSVYTTSYFSTSTIGLYAFDTTRSKTGGSLLTSWQSSSGGTTNQRLSAVFNTPQTFDEIRINNFHSSGSYTIRGMQDVKIHISDLSITDTTYDAEISDGWKIFDDVFNKHSAVNAEYEQILTLLPGRSMDILAGVPVLGSPDEPVVSGIPDDLLAGIPALGAPTGIYYHVADDLVTGVPVFNSPGGDFVITDLSNAKLIYTCTLNDVKLPMSSFQCRCRSGEQTYLSVVVPGIGYADDIAERSTGQLSVFSELVVNGVTRLKKEIAMVNLGTISLYNGTTNKSISLTGYRQETFAQKSVELSDYTYHKLDEDGTYRFRFASPNFSLNPGDEVTVNGQTFDVDTITYYVGINTSSKSIETLMEISG